MTAASQLTIAQQGVMAPPPRPDCPPGWRTGPPDFVGIGAQRAGTTRWFDLLVAHPEVEAPPATRKELHYFDRFHAGGFTPGDAAAYGDWFPRPAGRLTGEWTPVYLAAPWIPPLLAAAAPAAKLFVSLRDPVERYLSGLQRHHRTARAIDEPLNAMAPLEAFMRGFYSAQLSHLLAHFERSQVLVVQYERCVREPLRELRRSFAFLGLREEGFTEDLDVDAHPNRQSEKPALHGDARRALVDAYTPDVVALSHRFPEIDLGLWPNFAHLV
jgi:hypothetical protein